MKRKDIMRKLAEAGCVFEEGGNHTKVTAPDGRYTVVGRHTELPKNIVKAIEKQIGIKLI